jgi:hypothetical protein
VDGADLYLDLMKKCLLATIYDENSWYVLGSLDYKAKKFRDHIKLLFVNLAWRWQKILLVRPIAEPGEHGLFNYTMIGRPRLDNIQACIDDVLRNHIPGDFIETGVWRGGATIFMRAVLKARNVTDRNVWVADSFEGFPSLSEENTPYKDDTLPTVIEMNPGGPMGLGLAVPLSKVRAAFAKFDLLDDQVRFLKGWFHETLPTAPITKLAILRLDGDLYRSTMDVLEALYHKVSIGGYVIVDDYNCWPHCKKAIDEFRTARCINEKIVEIDPFAVYWKVTHSGSRKD